jgi:FkbM family methyltransferase
MIQALKRLASRLPSRYQQELKRLHFGRQIARGTFTTAEEHDSEYDRLHTWVKPGDWVLDLGANVGNYTARLSQLVGATGRVLAMEPVPETFELLTSNLARFPLRNVTLFNIAASNRIGLAGMNVPKLETGLENRYMARLSDVDSKFDVLCLPVDAFDLAAPVRFVKVDVEGHELQALQGMRNLLMRDHPVLVVEGRSAEVAAFLAGLGYSHEQTERSPNRVFRPRQTP